MWCGWTSKSGPNVVCFAHFDIKMCFAPQRRALFPHRNFEKCSDNEAFCAFWLRNLLRATTACTFSTSQLWKVLRQWSVLCILTSKPTFRPSGAPKHWKNLKHSVSRLFYFFRAPASSFFWLFLFSDFLPLPTSAFPSVHIVGSLTSKLPSMIWRCYMKIIKYY